MKSINQVFNRKLVILSYLTLTNYNLNHSPMRTTFIILLIVLISEVSVAQINKGAIFLDGSGGFNINRSVNDDVSNNYKTTYRNSQAYLGSQIAFFTSETFSLGAGVSFDFSRSSADNNGAKSKYSTNLVSLTTTATRYFNLVDKLYFTGALTLAGGAGITKNEPDETKYNMYEVRTNVAPGLAYFISNRWMVTTTIGSLFANYRWRKFNGPVEGNKYNEFNGGLSFELNTFSVGFRYLLHNGEE